MNALVLPLALCALLLAVALLLRARGVQAALQASQAALARSREHDALTGLPNRLQFERRLADAVALAAREPGGRLAVLFIDLDGFRPVNDSLGHAAGDDLLCQAARRLEALMAGRDFVARLGGDEFVALLHEDGSVPAALATAERAVQALSRPFDIGAQQVGISASVGIVVYPEDGQAERLLVHADAAMDAAKRAGGANFALYRPHMDADALDQMALQNDLRRALAGGELQLHYQPKVDAADGRVLGVEALLRWHHPQRGWVSPARFVPVAERFGLIGAVGDWVIDEACRQMADWSRQGLDMSVAVNVSVHQLRHGTLAGRLEAACRRHGVPPSRLLCEVTESAAMEDLRASQAVFDALLRAGVYLSIDDFGTGYSSLAYLRRLPARQLKIDRSFVADLEDSPDARAVVHAVLELAHALGLRVVAEGVETEAQRDILRGLGCDELQGWLFARPMPPAELLRWTAAREPEALALS